MPEQTNNQFDFEHWSMLATSDPEKFEVLRQKSISMLIDQSNGQRQQRLHGLQWQIDTMRTRHRNSTVAACLAISELMWETFNELAALLDLQADSASTQAVTVMQANIVPFPDKPKSQ